MSKRKSQSPPEEPDDDVTRPLPHALGPEKSVISTILQDPFRHIRQARRENVTKQTFYIPAHAMLFDFLCQIESNGEEIELVGLVQKLLDHGLLDRVGGPAYLTELYTYAPSPTYFAAHLQEIKNKAVLRQIIANAKANIDAAYDAPSEVEELIEQVAEQLADVTRQNENAASAVQRYRARLVAPEEIHDGVVDYLNGERLLGGDGFFLPDYNLGFRKHESTVWLGSSFHGKSQALQNQIANLAAHGRSTMIASFEQPPQTTLAQILNCFTGNPGLARTDEFEPAYAHINKLVKIYKGQERATPKHIIETFRQAYLNDGVDNFAIDNLMTLAVDRGDNSALASAIDMIRVFVADYPVHLHLVTHPRKPPDEMAAKPPTQNSIRGPAEIGDMPNNVIVVWRDMDKAERIAEMESSGYTEAAILEFYNSTPCGKFITRKQRATGDTPVANVWFNKQCNRFSSGPGRIYPMYSEKPW